jgi:hypothetical protein
MMPESEAYRDLYRFAQRPSDGPKAPDRCGSIRFRARTFPQRRGRVPGVKAATSDRWPEVFGRPVTVVGSAACAQMLADARDHLVAERGHGRLLSVVLEVQGEMADAEAG